MYKIFWCIRHLQRLQAQQRACDSWRATIGSTAIAAANSVFESCDDYSDEECQGLAQEQLGTLAFLYGDIEFEVRKFYLYRRWLIIINPAVLLSSSRTFNSSYFRSSLLCYSWCHQGPLSGRCDPAGKSGIQRFGYVCGGGTYSLSLTIVVPDCLLRSNVLSHLSQEVISHSRRSSKARRQTRN